MESYTKHEISPADIHRILTAQLGQNVNIARILSLKAGWFNTAYAIEFSDGQPDLVLRIAPPPDQLVLSYEKQLMRREVGFHQLAFAEIDVPVPALIAQDFTHQIIGRDYMLLARLPGVALDTVINGFTESQRQQLLNQLGQHAARISARRGTGFGYEGEFSSWREAFLDMIWTLFNDATRLQVTLPIAPDRIRQRLLELAPVLDHQRYPQLVHWDLWDGNIFVKPEGDQWHITGVTDWERSFWGDPFMDVVMYRKPQDPFWKGYGVGPGDDIASQVRAALYRLHLYLVMVIEDKVRFGGADHLPGAIRDLHATWQYLLDVDADRLTTP